MQVAEDQREVPLGKPAGTVDDSARRERLDPGGEAVTGCAEFGIGEIIEGGHVRKRPATRMVLHQPQPAALPARAIANKPAVPIA